MPLVSLLFALIVLGLIYYLIQQIPLPAPFQTVVTVIFILILIIFVLHALGLIGYPIYLK